MSSPAAVPALRVLVVDDNADDAYTLTTLIASWGHAVKAAQDGPGALTAAEGFRPDVALIDIGLPGMDGCEVARRLRELPGLGGVALLAMTGYWDKTYRRPAATAGFAFYFVRPPDLGELEALLGGLAWEREKPTAG